MTDRVPMPNAVSKTSTGATVTNVAEGRDPRALRAEPIPPQQLTPEQQPYYQLSKRQIEEQFSGCGGNMGKPGATEAPFVQEKALVALLKSPVNQRFTLAVTTTACIAPIDVTSST